MRLLVGHHLQPVLDHPQKAVGGVEVGVRLRVDPVAVRQRLERHQRLALAQLRMPAAGNQLLGLHEEFDLADAATAELDVVALDRDVVVTAIGVDLPLHRVDVGDRRKVEVLAPDERRLARAAALRRPR